MYCLVVFFLIIIMAQSLQSHKITQIRLHNGIILLLKLDDKALLLRNKYTLNLRYFLSRVQFLKINFNSLVAIF
jgi:hypothetical protein